MYISPLITSPNMLRQEPPRAVTAEVELSSHNRDVMDTFRFHHAHVRAVSDGSVTGDAPVEFIVGPIPGPAFPSAMKELGQWLTSATASVNSSCGMHAHVDGRDLSAFAIRRLLLLYKVMEPTFYNLVAPGRDSNRYSRMFTSEEWARLQGIEDITSSSKLREKILRSTYLGVEDTTEGSPELFRSLRRRTSTKYDEARYRGLNLHSWFHRGTFEFRQHEGCVDIERISHWLRWCKWFVELADRLRDDEVQAIRRPEDLLLGCWKRSYGLLSLPGDLTQYVQGGRALLPLSEAPPRGGRGNIPSPPRSTAPEGSTLYASTGSLRGPVGASLNNTSSRT